MDGSSPLILGDLQGQPRWAAAPTGAPASYAGWQNVSIRTRSVNR